MRYPVSITKRTCWGCEPPVAGVALRGLTGGSPGRGSPGGVVRSATDPSGVVSTEVRVDNGAWLSMTRPPETA